MTRSNFIISLNENINKLRKKGAFKALMIFVIGAGIEFGSNVVFARILGKDGYGIYSYAINWLNLMIIPGLLGFGTSTLRFLPQYYSLKQWNLYSGFLKYSKNIVVLASIITSIIGIGCVFLLGSNLSEVEILTMSIVFVSVPFFSMIMLSRFRFQSIKMQVLSLAPQRIFFPVVLMIFLFLVFLLIPSAVSPWLLSIAYLLLSIFTSFILNVIFSNKTKRFLDSSGNDFQKSEWLKVSIPLSFINNLQYLLKQTGVLMLGILIGTDVVGVYNVSLKINQFLLLGLLSINFVVTPQISKLFYSGEKYKLQKLVTRSTRQLFAITIMLALFILIGGKWILSFFGEEFVSSYTALLIMNVGNILNALSGSVGVILSMTGHQNLSFKIILISVILTIVLNYILIPVYGIEGAAISTALALILRNGVMVYYVHKLTGINSTVFSFNKFKKL